VIASPVRTGTLRRLSAFALGICCLLILAAAASSHAATLPLGGPAWPSGGQNIFGTRSNSSEWQISPSNASRLATKWTYTTHGDVSATPAVVNGAVYFPDWGGYLNKVNAYTGKQIWSHKISDYDGVATGISRTSPAVVGDTVYIGDQNGGHLIAIDAATGALRWIQQLDSHPLAAITQSPLVFRGVVYLGVSSLEENAAGDPSYPCCTFRGSLNAIDAKTGKVLWKTYTVPDNGGKLGGYSGGSVWGGTPTLDPATNTVFVGTGNNYEMPQSVHDCQVQHPDDASACLSPDDHIDGVLALDASNGKIKWASDRRIFDAWTRACIAGIPAPNNCPANAGPDANFGAGINLMHVRGPHGTLRTVVGGGDKAGRYWELDAATGAVLWSDSLGPGSVIGGIQWGTATDGKRIYVSEDDVFGIPYTLPNGQTITSGSYAALDVATGKVLWQIPDPSGSPVDIGAVSTANGVVYVSSMSGHMYALDARDGKVLRDLPGAGSSNAGPAIANGVVYWGNGYSHLPIPGATGSTTFYAFSLGGR
jgi:polyvinyl alcohol dehydrogenase (cytochrome)